MTTVHMIGNAHLDPVWFWQWPVGIHTTISTCRTIVDLMDLVPEFVFTRSDVWLYQQIERSDKGLFSRIRELVEKGRWQIVGGWFIQPDCNLPLGESFRKHTTLGLQYFNDTFGVIPTVGYNVDSFGHAASIPDILSEYGFDSYVFLRPGPHEKNLPGSLFEWCGLKGGQLTTWRIHERYNCSTPEQLEKNIIELVDSSIKQDIDHVMCFYGVGDHGGGPSLSQIQWIKDHRTAFEGAVLEFSHPRKFFDSVKESKPHIPTVKDELQFHAIGCYSVVRDIKVAMRQAESTLLSAEESLTINSNHTNFIAKQNLDKAWERVLFNQFHDILAGTSIRKACQDAIYQLGEAISLGQDIIQKTVLEITESLDPHQEQRMVVYNPTHEIFDGFVVHEPWLEWTSFEGILTLKNNEEIPFQIVQQEALSGPLKSLLFPVKVPAGGFLEIFLHHKKSNISNIESNLEFGFVNNDNKISNSEWIISCFNQDNKIVLKKNDSSSQKIDLQLKVYEDFTDTWSHDVSGYRFFDYSGIFTISSVVLIENGPLRSSLGVLAKWNHSEIFLDIKLYRNSEIIEIDSRLLWAENLRICKLELHFGEKIIQHRDGIPDNVITRPANGYEYPIIDFTHIDTESGSNFTVLSKDIFSLDVNNDSLGLTICRSPAYAWQGRKLTLNRNSVEDWTDQGVHRFKVCLMPEVDSSKAKKNALHIHRPPVIVDSTKGMSLEFKPYRGNENG